MHDAAICRLDRVVECYQAFGLRDAGPAVQREFFRAVSTCCGGGYGALRTGLSGGSGRRVRTVLGADRGGSDGGVWRDGKDTGYVSGSNVGGKAGSGSRGSVGVSQGVDYGARGTGPVRCIGDWIGCGKDVGGGNYRGRDDVKVDSSVADDPWESDVESAPKVGKWRKKNNKKKENRRLREAIEVGQVADVLPRVEVCDSGSWRQSAPRAMAGKSEAQKTLEAKWVVENKLKTAEAERKLQLLELQDVAEVAKLRERKMKAAGERAMVQIEKSHATLAATGNVPGVVPKGGYCTTVLDDPGLSDGSSPTCTISPDSSASMQELRELQKINLDQEKEIKDLKKLVKRRETMAKATYAQSVAEFTAGSESVMSDGLKCELDRKFGERYEYDGKIDGKHVVRRIYHDGGMDNDSVCDELLDVY